MIGAVGVDTSLLIDFFNGDKEAVEFIRKYRNVLRVSQIVIYEFLCGNLNEKQKDIFLLGVQSFPKVDFSYEAALQASKIYRSTKKRGKTIGHQDCLVAGSYIASGITNIVTENTKHFKNIKDIKVISYR